MKATTLAAGSTLRTVNTYTGRVHEWKVLSVSPKATQIIVERTDWQTGKMMLTYRPSYGQYHNEYANEVYVSNEVHMGAPA